VLLDSDPCHVARSLQVFLSSPDEVAALQARLAETVGLLGGTGAHQRAARAVAAWFPGES
jgi:hypothetical protein